MEETFNAVEVFKIAEQIERDAAEFYRLAASKFQIGDINAFFFKLADWDLKHEEVFASMRSRLEETQPTIKVTDPEKCRAMAALSEFAITSGTPKELTASVTIRDVMEMALKKEKDSVTFYTGLKDFVADKTAVEQIDEIIAEERRHIELIKSKL